MPAFLDGNWSWARVICMTWVESEKPFDIFFGRTQKKRLNKKKASFFVENEGKGQVWRISFFGAQDTKTQSTHWVGCVFAVMERLKQRPHNPSPRGRRNTLSFFVFIKTTITTPKWKGIVVNLSFLQRSLIRCRTTARKRQRIKPVKQDQVWRIRPRQKAV